MKKQHGILYGIKYDHSYGVTYIFTNYNKVKQMSKLIDENIWDMNGHYIVTNDKQMAKKHKITYSDEDFQEYYDYSEM